MALSNTAVPKYYGEFRDAVIAGEIPVCETISLEMNRIDKLIDDPTVYYDESKVEGFIEFCENELTLTDGTDLHLLPTFKLWAEQVLVGIITLNVRYTNWTQTPMVGVISTSVYANV